MELGEGESDPDGNQDHGQPAHESSSPGFAQARMERAEAAVDGHSADNADGVERGECGNVVGEEEDDDGCGGGDDGADPGSTKAVELLENAGELAVAGHDVG